MSKEKVTGGRAGQSGNREKKGGPGRTGSESNESKGKRREATSAKQPSSAGKKAGSGKDDPENVPRSGGVRSGRTPASGRNRTR